MSWVSAGVRLWQWAAPGLAPWGELQKEDTAWSSPPCAAKLGPSVAVAAMRLQGPTES